MSPLPRRFAMCQLVAPVMTSTTSTLPRKSPQSHVTMCKTHPPLVRLCTSLSFTMPCHDPGPTMATLAHATPRPPQRDTHKPRRDTHKPWRNTHNLGATPTSPVATPAQHPRPHDRCGQQHGLAPHSPPPPNSTTTPARRA
ncbi:hypothetical protein EDB89DRAFT_1901058 [Lactarius sanguifluus]|nr:hypothetical protein EDB89DRAFT_1901058 [Lactarius sanguifluus]